MDCATIMVHLDASRRVYQRLHIAAQLALEFQATVVGVLAIGKPDLSAMRYLVNGDRYLTSYNEWHAQVGKETRHALEGATDELQIAAEWRAPEWATAETVQAEAHLADLVVLGQHDPSDESAYAGNHFVESVVLQCGRPVLVVPYAGWFPRVGKHVLVAWNGSRESARAVHDALPLLKRAESVDIVSCTRPETPRDPWLSPPHYAVAGLARHGVKAHLHESVIGSGDDAGQMLLSLAVDLSADLIVMGAYGHGRMRELMLGGVTRALLSSMTVPVLMSH